jgi:hypothetical protein
MDLINSDQILVLSKKATFPKSFIIISPHQMINEQETENIQIFFDVVRTFCTFFLYVFSIRVRGARRNPETERQNYTTNDHRTIEDKLLSEQLRATDEL